jgi:hypothetical protein
MTMMRKVTRRTFVLVAAAAVCTIPKMASAHAGNDSPNVVHACIGNVTKIVRIVGVSGSCITSPPIAAETPAHWDIQGPQGVPGTNGTNGTNGIDGTNGKDGNYTGGESSFTGVASAEYWSSTTYVDFYFGGAIHVWAAHLDRAEVSRLDVKSATLRVWPARGGPR